jgi:hypothetical protein
MIGNSFPSVSRPYLAATAEHLDLVRPSSLPLPILGLGAPADLDIEAERARLDDEPSREGLTEHIGRRNHLPHISTFIADWVADAFAGLSPGRR